MVRIASGTFILLTSAISENSSRICGKMQVNLEVNSKWHNAGGSSHVPFELVLGFCLHLRGGFGKLACERRLRVRSCKKTEWGAHGSMQACRLVPGELGPGSGYTCVSSEQQSSWVKSMTVEVDSESVELERRRFPFPVRSTEEISRRWRQMRSCSRTMRAGGDESCSSAYRSTCSM